MGQDGSCIAVVRHVAIMHEHKHQAALCVKWSNCAYNEMHLELTCSYLQLTIPDLTWYDCIHISSENLVSLAIIVSKAFHACSSDRGSQLFAVFIRYLSQNYLEHLFLDGILLSSEVANLLSKHIYSNVNIHMKDDTIWINFVLILRFRWPIYPR